MSIATSSDVTDYDPSLTLPARVDRYIRIAEGLVADAIRLSVYVADPLTGLPSSVANVAAMREAVCAQVAWWIDSGTDPTGAGFAAGGEVITSKQLSPVGSVSYDAQAQKDLAAARAAGADRLCSEAWRVLTRAGLGRTVVIG